jgi:hypothetical protein
VRIGADDFDGFVDVCRAHHVIIADAMDRQLADLASIRYPAASDAAERKRFIAEYIAARGSRDVCGNRVVFPWLRTAVHLLEADDYVEVITNRNHDKITREEQRLLRTKRIGVIGLSVGAEAAVAVAQEHLCGEIVLADFDRLDLSNLNRLHAGCDELGLLKTTIAARRIARIDPYLRITTFDAGVDETNADRFLDGLDLLIEECDGLSMKWDLRLHAKARGLNVIYAADERGFLSIEPYATSPGFPVFHGVIGARPLPREAHASPVAFMHELTKWLGGWDGISERSRDSLERIGADLCGYPQLASEARFAAGQLGHVARRLLLGERLPPCVEQMDLATAIGAT